MTYQNYVSLCYLERRPVDLVDYWRLREVVARTSGQMDPALSMLYMLRNAYRRPNRRTVDLDNYTSSFLVLNFYSSFSVTPAVLSVFEVCGPESLRPLQRRQTDYWRRIYAITVKRDEAFFDYLAKEEDVLRRLLSGAHPTIQAEPTR